LYKIQQYDISLPEYLFPYLGVPVQEAMEKGAHTVRSLLTLLAAYTFQ